MKDKTFHEVIEKIVEKEQPYGILLVGSLSRMSELNFEEVRDIDIFVITNKEEFTRQVEIIKGLEFDISYMPMKLLELSIERILSSVICVLAKSKILYETKDNTLKDSLKVIKSIYEEGPPELSKIDIDYQRFKLTESFITLESRRNDSLNFNFLKGIFLKDLLTSYFKLNNIWMPPNKRMLKTIKDKKIISLIDHKSSDLDNLNQLLTYILEPFGGKLEFWEKNNFPFDFL